MSFEEVLLDEEKFKRTVLVSLTKLEDGQVTLTKSLNTYIESNDKRAQEAENNIEKINIIVTGNGSPEKGLCFQLSMLKKYWIICTSVAMFIVYFAADLVKGYITSLFNGGK